MNSTSDIVRRSNNLISSFIERKVRSKPLQLNSYRTKNTFVCAIIEFRSSPRRKGYKESLRALL